jgi:hypothetical protein
MMEKRKILALFLMALTLFVVVQNAYAETIPTAVPLQPYDTNLNIYHATIGSRRQTTWLPSGQWYTNINFDPDPSNYAKVGVDGYAYLRAYSYATFWPDMHGWSNAYFHQGRVPYSGGIYEGKFKDYYTNQDVDGIKYILWDDPNFPNYKIHQEPEGKIWLIINLKITKRYVNSMNAFASVLFFALFQYEYVGGTLSEYDSPAGTNGMQALHYDIFLSRARRMFWWYSEDSPGTETTDWGDAYNKDIHVQRVVGKMNVGQTYCFILDWGFLINRAKQMFVDKFWGDTDYPPVHVNALILRWIGVSAEVIGSELEVQVDYVGFLVSE